MKGWLYVVLMCAMCVSLSQAHAQPATNAKDALEAARRAATPAEALTKLEEGLALSPSGKELQELLEEKGDVLEQSRDYKGAIAAFEALLATGPSGAKRRTIKKRIEVLREAEDTFLEVSAPRGTFDVSLKNNGNFCTAAPSCKANIVPGQYRVEARGKGFAPWSKVVTIDVGKVTAVAIAASELPSQLSIGGAPSGASITVDGQPYAADAQLPAGPHVIIATAEGYVESKLEVVAALGEPVNVTIELTPLLPVRVVPANAALLIDGKPVTVTGGKVAVPKGAREIVARAGGYKERRLALPTERTPATALEVLLEAEAPARPAPPPAPSRFTTLRKVAIGTAGVSVAAVGLGLVFGRASRIKEDEAFDRCPIPTECDQPDAANHAIDEAQTAATNANLSFGLAGGAAAATVMLWILGAPDAPSRETPVAISPLLGPTSGLAVSGSF